MIRWLISVAFALAVATSAEAMSPAPLHEPDTMITQIRNARQAHQPCDLPSQVRINGICMLRSTTQVRRPQIHNVRPAHQPCDLPSQIRINGICMLRSPVRRPQIHDVRPAHQPCDLPSQVRINGICMLRSTPHHVPPTRLPWVCEMERRYMR